jgi:hypothetical protein
MSLYYDGTTESCFRYFLFIHLTLIHKRINMVLQANHIDNTVLNVCTPGLLKHCICDFESHCWHGSISMFSHDILPCVDGSLIRG